MKVKLIKLSSDAGRFLLEKSNNIVRVNRAKAMDLLMEKLSRKPNLHANASSLARLILASHS